MNEDYPIRAIPLSDEETIHRCASMLAAADTWKKLGLDYALCRRSFEGPGKEVYVIFDGEQAAGVVILQMNGTFKGYIQSICVDAAYRGKGLGTRLIAFCEERIRRESPNVFLCVSDFNTEAQRLYQRLGYEKVGDLPNFIREGFTEYLMRKTFGPLLPNKEA